MRSILKQIKYEYVMDYAICILTVFYVDGTTQKKTLIVLYKKKERESAVHMWKYCHSLFVSTRRARFVIVRVMQITA